MPAKTKGARASKKSSASKPRPRAKASDETAAATTPAAPDNLADTERDARNFTRGVLIRGEAATPDEAGKLPPGATHEIVGEDEEGLPVIKRSRYSAF